MTASVETLAPGSVPRPPTITPGDWARMPWPAKWRASRRWAAVQAQNTADELEQEPIQPIVQRRFGPNAIQPHGTNAAYRRHERAGEEPCRPCREARRQYNRDRYQTGRIRRDDFDPVLVDRFIHGAATWQELTVAERVAAAIRLDASGVSRNEIRRRTHLNTHTLRYAFQAAS